MSVVRWRRRLPQSASPGRTHDGDQIVDRSNEISFSSSLIRKMRTIKFNTRLVDEGKIVDGSVKRMFIHALGAEGAMASFDVASRPSADWA
jgi:NTE family protein